MADAAVRIRDVSYAAGSVQILSAIALDFQPGRFNVVLGPNGAGKSTLMRIAAGRLAPTSGDVLYGETSVAAFDMTALARRRAFLSQNVELTFPLAVEDVVLMGRYPHYRGVPSLKDKEIVARALDLVDMTARRHQPYPTLSGGERQKTHLARVLAQIWNDEESAEERILFLDEPTTSLDIHYQLHLLDTAREFLKRRCTIVASLHDLNMAFDYGDRFFLLESGRLVHEADSARAVPKDLIERVYRVKAETGEGGYWRFRL
ncbi:MAG TPA: ATP-binding cassette domain-containing protein [Rhizomicrobium sp.]|nr:ATP-binding cassette domain-containing protein [Rhizomicrobium sp.]